MKVGDLVYCKKSCISSVCWHTKKNWYKVVEIQPLINYGTTGNYFVYIQDNVGTHKVFTIDDSNNYLEISIFGKYFYTSQELRKAKLNKLNEL